MFKRLSLTKKSMISLNLMGVTLMIAMAVIMIQRMKTNANMALDGKINTIAEFLGKASATPLWNFDSEVMETFADELGKDADIAYVNFLDKEKKPITKSRTIEGDFEIMLKPIPVPKETTVNGWVEIAYRRDSVKATVKLATFLVIGFAVGFQICIAFGVWFFVGRASKRLEQQVEKLKETASDTSKTSEVIKEVSANLSKRGTSQAAAVEETSTALTEITSIVKQNADSAEKAYEFSTQSYNLALNGQKEVTALLEAMSGINDSAKKIQEIINVVDDISFQTNLLALNAAVEAARAGEQGKGFAVVADAVRSLAQRSSVAAKDISVMIKDSVQRIEQGSKLVESNSKVLNEVLKSAEQVRELNSQIASASNEQSQGISQISRAMSEIDTAVNESAQSSQEANSQAESLTHQSEALSEIIRLFEKEINGQEKAS